MEIMFKCHACLLENVEAFGVNLANDSFLPMKKQVYDVKNSVTFDFATSAFEANSFECILFQGKATFDCVVKNIRALWEPIINDYVKCTKEIALESIHLLRQDKRTKCMTL